MALKSNICHFVVTQNPRWRTNFSVPLDQKVRYDPTELPYKNGACCQSVIGPTYSTSTLHQSVLGRLEQDPSTYL